MFALKHKSRMTKGKGVGKKPFFEFLESGSVDSSLLCLHV